MRNMKNEMSSCVYVSVDSKIDNRKNKDKSTGNRTGLRFSEINEFELA